MPVISNIKTGQGSRQIRHRYCKIVYNAQIVVSSWSVKNGGCATKLETNNAYVIVLSSPSMELQFGKLACCL